MSIAVLYLARGADQDAFAKFARFRRSYRACRAGVAHDLVVIRKGFSTAADETAASLDFAELAKTQIRTVDSDFDLGAYRRACLALDHDYVCILNTHSEVLAPDWLAKLFANATTPGVGAVSATGSFESLNSLDFSFPKFPNVHLRTNALMMKRRDLIELFPERVPDKTAAFMLESGRASLSRRLLSQNRSILVVGRDGRGFPPIWWPESGTFRVLNQANLLVGDNVSRTFERASVPERIRLARLTWGDYLSDRPQFALPRL